MEWEWLDNVSETKAWIMPLEQGMISNELYLYDRILEFQEWIASEAG
jgi:hypothetical protein